MKPQRTPTYSQKLTKTLGHDLKQPLSVIKIAAYYLKKTSSGKQLDQLQKIEQQVDILSEALSDLADAERVFEDGVSLSMEYFSLSDVFEAVCSEFKVLRPRSLKTIALPDKNMVMGDKVRSHQSLLALLHAVASLKNRDGQLEVKLVCKARFTVCTIVCQMTEVNEDLCKAFWEPFGLSDFQDHGRGYHVGGNLGLGPFIAKAILEAQKGRVKASLGTLCINVELQFLSA